MALTDKVSATLHVNRPLQFIVFQVCYNFISYFQNLNNFVFFQSFWTSLSSILKCILQRGNTSSENDENEANLEIGNCLTSSRILQIYLVHNLDA